MGKRLPVKFLARRRKISCNFGLRFTYYLMRTLLRVGQHAGSGEKFLCVPEPAFLWIQRPTGPGGGANDE